MSEIISNKPVCTLVMGCNGAGKTAWKRRNYDCLPDDFIDQDSVAGGFGDWDNDENREKTRIMVDKHIDSLIDRKRSFGTESTFSGRPGVELMRRVINEGYVVHGVYVGTNNPELNIQRVNYRVEERIGHWVEPSLIPERHKYSLSNLRKLFDQFEELELIDNSQHDDAWRPNPITQCYAFRGVIKSRIAENEMAPWCSTLLERIENVREQRAKQEKRDARKQKRRDEESGLGR